MRRVLLLLIIIFTASAGSAAILTPRQLAPAERWADLQQLVQQIKSQYGPRHFKALYLGVTADALASEFWPRMSAARDNGEFYALIVQFVARFRDTHFSARIPTTRAAALPFMTTLIGERAIIDTVDREKLPLAQFPFERGDELLALDGRPVAELVAEFSQYTGDGNPRTTQGFATYALTYRSGRVFPLPQGPVLVTIRPRHAAHAVTVPLTWVQEGEDFDEYVLPVKAAMTTLLVPDDEPTAPTPAATDFSDLSIRTELQGRHPDLDRTYHCSGGTRIHIPEDATVLMQEPFVAYYHPTRIGNVGYLRIPHYKPPDEEYDAWVENYRWALATLEAHTKGLIIDQDHNCGGSVFFLETLLSFFLDRSFQGLQFRLLASKAEWIQWQEWRNEISNPHNLIYEGLSTVMDLIADSVSKGYAMTPVTTLLGGQWLTPQAVYTKPVLILIDRFAGSGGDAFPAMMQGLGRAKLLGSTTMGAGGHVNIMTPLFYSQIKTRMTKSLFFHPDGTAIENHGAVPDIPYETTVADLLGEYRDYQQFYLEQLITWIRERR